jgi:hypothetical protein
MASKTNVAPDSSDDSICPVCYRGLDDSHYAVQPCGHAFCSRCLAEHLWREQAASGSVARCPMCRQPLVEAAPAKPASRVLRLKLGKAAFHVRVGNPLTVSAESRPLLSLASAANTLCSSVMNPHTTSFYLLLQARIEANEPDPLLSLAKLFRVERHR